MKLEVLLSVMSFDIKNFDRMNIDCPCTVIDQCNKEGKKKYKNFNIYYSKERGAARSRNMALDLSKEDILLLADDDLIYNEGFSKNIVEEFKNNPKADVIVFNVNNPYRKKRIIKKRKRLHIYNSLNFASYNIAFRRKSIKNIRFNTSFGAGSSKYNCGGEDSLFITQCLKNKLKIYSSPIYIGSISGDDSTWFKGYDEKFLFNKGALLTAISPRFRHLLILQALIRHKEMHKDIKFFNAYKIMLKGSKDYLKHIKENL